MTEISANVVEDSISEAGARLTTMVWRYPRFIHSEIMTHRVLSRNAASSRAIPVEKMIEQVMNDPAMPVYWGKNQKGMQAREELTGDAKRLTVEGWLLTREHAVMVAGRLVAMGLHKQIANRLLEPWMWMTTLVTATEWDNFFTLRCHPDAQPEFQVLAKAALVAMNGSTPRLVKNGGWHLPFVSSDTPHRADLVKCSVARCARVSYLNHDKSNPDPVKDCELADKLLASGHMSPFEHVAQPGMWEWSGNFYGWTQYRKTLGNENRRDFPGLKKYPQTAVAS